MIRKKLPYWMLLWVSFVTALGLFCGWMGQDFILGFEFAASVVTGIGVFGGLAIYATHKLIDG